MDKIFDTQSVAELFGDIRQWFSNEFMTANTLAQGVGAIVTLAVASLIAPRLRRWLESRKDTRWSGTAISRSAKSLAPLSAAVSWLILLWLSAVIFREAGWRNHLLVVVVSLLAAWVVIRLVTSFVKNPGWATFWAVAAWTIAALNIVNLLDPAIAVLNGLAVTVGGLRVSALTVIKGALLLALLLWLAMAASSLLERRIRNLPSLTPSIQVLVSKVLKITLFTIAIVITLNSVGIDLTAFAVFGGALGVGLGFGLQKVVSNFVSGIILLLDKSIKPGDVIAVSNSYGWVESLGARYVSLVTRDGTEHLIPNETLITERVENWSHTNNLLRLKIPVGVSYKSDVDLAIRVCLDAAADTPRVLDQPKSVCLIKGFGNSSVDLELRIWINDPRNGVSNVRSEVLHKVWHKFHEHGVEIPFPQRDLHIRSPEVIQVQSGPNGGSGDRRLRQQAGSARPK